LILTICSLIKKDGGREQYNDTETISFKLSPKIRERLLDGRIKSLDLLFSGRLEWQGVPLPNLDYNKELVYGKDFGGDAKHAKYMPALFRYNGRFYGALGVDGKNKLVHSKHHVLFQSGLYGLIKPMESIQLYSYPIEGQSLAQDIWIKDDLLTKALIDYIRVNEIIQVFDFTSRKDYRDIFNWEMVKGSTGAGVLHGFSIMGGGDDALVPFSNLMKEYLLEASEKELLSIKAETEIRGILFREIPYSRQDLPREELEKILVREREREREREIQGLLKSKENNWSVHFLPEFKKVLARKGDIKDIDLVQAIMEIVEDPLKLRGDTIKPLTGIYKGKWRYRIGDYRLIYYPDTETHAVFLISIVPRGNAYE
jgi:mRNA-degrading endonuclease RelE of RelBE toxin-antitoxin system